MGARLKLDEAPGAKCLGTSIVPHVSSEFTSPCVRVGGRGDSEGNCCCDHVTATKLPGLTRLDIPVQPDFPFA